MNCSKLLHQEAAVLTFIWRKMFLHEAGQRSYEALVTSHIEQDAV